MERKMGKSAEKVVSPLAKYDSNGNLFCLICKNLIKSSAIWKVHINSKTHKFKVEEAKKVNKTTLKNALPSNKNRKEGSQTLSNSENSVSKHTDAPHISKDMAPNRNNSICIVQDSSDCLPEMFFDDPIADAKIRNVEYKSVQDDEWERFQREMKEESTSSNKLIFGEQTNSALSREITEINEQMHRWSKVIDLENKLKNIVKKGNSYNEIDNDTDEDISDDGDNEYIDWRSKKFT